MFFAKKISSILVLMVLLVGSASFGQDGQGTSPLSIAKGGTGGGTASVARTNLGAAPIASPAFTGIPTAPTATAGTNTNQIASTAFVADAVASSGVATFGGQTGNISVGIGLSMSGTTLNLTGANSTSINTIDVPVTAAMCGKTVEITGGYHTFTIPAGSPSSNGFFEGCWIAFKNGDTWLNGIRGKGVFGFPSDFTPGQGVIWPNQAGAIRVLNDTFATVIPTGRAKLPPNTVASVNAYSDVSNATGDSFGNDCLSQTISSGTGPCMHAQKAAYLFCNEFDGTAFPQSKFIVNLVNSGGGRDQVGVHFAAHCLGQQGGAALIFSCGTGAGINGVNTDAIASEVGAVFSVVGCQLTSTGTIANSTRLPDCIRSNYPGSTIFALQNTFGNCAGARYNASNNASIQINDNDFIFASAVAQAHWRVATGGTISTDFNSTNVTTSVVGGGSTSVSSAWAAANSGLIYVPGWSLASGTVTGVRELTTGAGSIWTGTNSNANCTGTGTPYFPGTSNGTTAAPFCL